MFGLGELAEALEHAGLLLLARLQGQNGEPGGFKDVRLPLMRMRMKITNTHIGIAAFTTNFLALSKNYSAENSYYS